MMLQSGHCDEGLKCRYAHRKEDLRKFSVRRSQAKARQGKAILDESNCCPEKTVIVDESNCCQEEAVILPLPWKLLQMETTKSKLYNILDEDAQCNHEECAMQLAGSGKQMRSNLLNRVTSDCMKSFTEQAVTEVDMWNSLAHYLASANQRIPSDKETQGKTATGESWSFTGSGAVDALLAHTDESSQLKVMNAIIDLNMKKLAMYLEGRVASWEFSASF